MLAPAIAAHVRLLKACPDDGDAWFNLGWLQQQARRHEAALGAYRMALARGAAAPAEVHVAIAVVLAEGLERPDEAEAALHRALGVDPRHVAAHVNLGNLHEQRGRRTEAARAYAAALAVEPGHALALARLAGVSALQGADDPAIARLRRALSQPALSDAEAADLGFALANALERVGAHAEAFDACAEANRRGRAAGGGVAYDRAAHEQQVDRLIAAFPRTPAGLADDDDGLGRVFVCGMFRSGSTLVEQMLASHPQVAAGGEIDLLPVAAQAFYPMPPAPFAPPSATALQQLRADYRARTARGGVARVVTDKRPDNVLHLGLVKTLFPRARIVHTRRDPRDNCLSVWFQHLGPAMAYAYALEDIAHWHGQQQRLLAHWRRLFGDDILEVDYDALVADPAPQAAALLAHCGLPWDDRVLDFHRTERVVRTPSAGAVREPLYRHASGRWHHHAGRLQPLLAALERAGTMPAPPARGAASGSP